LALEAAVLLITRLSYAPEEKNIYIWRFKKKKKKRQNVPLTSLFIIDQLIVCFFTPQIVVGNHQVLRRVFFSSCS